MKKQTIYFYILIIILCSCKKQTTISPNYTSKIVSGTYFWHGYKDGTYRNGNRFHDLINDTFSIIKIDNNNIGYNYNHNYPNAYDTLVYLSTNDSQHTITFVQTQSVFAFGPYPFFLFYNYVTNSMTVEEYYNDSSLYFFHIHLQTP